MCLGEFIGIDGFHLHLNGLNMMQDDMTELMVKVVDIFDIPECGGFRKNIILAQSQGITADPIVVVPKQKLFGFCLVFNRKTARPKNFNLFINRFSTLAEISLQQKQLNSYVKSVLVPLNNLLCFIKTISNFISSGNRISGFSELSDTIFQVQFSLLKFNSSSRYSISLPVQIIVALF